MRSPRLESANAPSHLWLTRLVPLLEPGRVPLGQARSGLGQGEPVSSRPSQEGCPPSTQPRGFVPSRSAEFQRERQQQTPTAAWCGEERVSIGNSHHHALARAFQFTNGESIRPASTLQAKVRGPPARARTGCRSGCSHSPSRVRSAPTRVILEPPAKACHVL
jgi:hypothetical protein